jgi:hypothetical protein
MRFRRKIPQQRQLDAIVKELDGISGGLVSAVKPDEVNCVGDNKFEGHRFNLGYTVSNDMIGFSLIADYDSPIGMINLAIAVWGASASIVERDMSKETLDTF